MPAVTVSDITVLPRVPDPDVAATDRPVRSITTAPSGFEGEGFPVRRACAGIEISDLDPFLMMDQMGEVEYAPGESKGTSWHPHRGFETVTYIMDGTFEHADSHGGGGVITNGDTQWMTAGGGLLHIERPPESLVASGGLSSRTARPRRSARGWGRRPGSPRPSRPRCWPRSRTTRRPPGRDPGDLRPAHRGPRLTCPTGLSGVRRRLVGCSPSTPSGPPVGVC